MHHHFVLRQRAESVMIPGGVLLGVWLAGLSLGLLAARSYGDECGSLMLSAGETALTYFDACVAALLPLLLSAFAVLLFHRPGAYAFCLLRGIAIGFYLGVLMSAGGLWLAMLLLFSGLLSSPLILWYLWRRLGPDPGGALTDCLRCGLAGLVLAAADTWLVAPFLATALSF